MQFDNLIYVDNSRAMYANKASLIETLLYAAQRLAREIATSLHKNFDVFTDYLNQFDIAGRYQKYSAVFANQQLVPPSFLFYPRGVEVVHISVAGDSVED